MLLVDMDIHSLIRREGLIEPSDPYNIQPSSYDVSLGDHFIWYVNDTISLDENNDVVEFTVPEDTKYLIFDKNLDTYFKVDNDTVYIKTPCLGCTKETVKLPDTICAIYTGRSSLGRCFFTSHVTAAYIDNGYSGKITLEIMTSDHKVKIPRGSRIGQLLFIETDKPKVSYRNKHDAKYNNSEKTVPTKAYIDYKKAYYCDASVDNNPGKCGCVGYLTDDGISNCIYIHNNDKKLSSYLAEIYGVLWTLLNCEHDSIIYTDCASITISMKSKSKKRKYKQLIDAICKLSEYKNVVIKHKKGHTYCDEIDMLLKNYMINRSKTLKTYSLDELNMVISDAVSCITDKDR